MAQIILHLADDLAERLAPFRDRLPELLERGLRDLLSSPEEDAQVTTNATVQRLETLENLHQLRSNIQIQHGIYRDVLGAGASSTCEKELEEAYALAAQETDSAWDITLTDGLTDEAWCKQSHRQPHLGNALP